MIAELNREQGATILLTTHVMEEAEELCGEIALLRQGELMAHQPTAQLTRSLRLARPITISARRGAAETEASASEWLGQLAALPGVTQPPSIRPVEPDAAAPTGEMVTAGGDLTFIVHTLDLRATTPALLAWVRATGLDLISM